MVRVSMNGGIRNSNDINDNCSTHTISNKVNGSLQAMVVSRRRMLAGQGIKKVITLPRRAANAYGSYSANGNLQAMVVSSGWVFAG